MIDPRELRIGNWVSVNPNYVDGDMLRPFQVWCVDKEAGILLGGADIPFDFDDIIPIELTPDILEKAGFTVPDGYKDTVLLKDNVMIDLHEGKYLLRDNYMIVLKYLHQLQNLYYSLTGQELTYAP